MAIEPAEGRPWVLLPGTLCSGRVFEPLLDRLGVPEAARHPVALRYPRVEDYLDEVTTACVPGAVVCGFSLGAIVAAHLADRLPSSAFLLFALNPLADRPEARAGRLDLAREVGEVGGARALAARLPALTGPSPDRTRAMILDMAEVCSGLIEAQTELALTRPGALKTLARTTAPISFLTGTGDTWAPLALAETAAQATPAGRFVPLEGLGHYALVEDPDACCAAVAHGFTLHQGMTE
ncbi:alpha/beta hydrolase [Fluviibacterium sp. DFM31]|uniref:Alpha/beta hydrolase n=1 Tax=Meridianimarinicoccus marinus TaxID=3231483 RepID=A0ABV3L815_9RHOB